jgi:hypothetical protein
MGFAPAYQVSGNGGGATNSGTAWNMTKNVGVGRSVLMVIRVRGSDTVASVSGLGATWSKIISVQRGSSAGFTEIWIGTGTTGGTKAITPTMTGGSQYSAAALELDAIGSATSGGTAKASSGTPTLTISGLAAGDMLVAACASSNTLSSGPSSPWSLFTFAGASNTFPSSDDNAYQLTADATNQTATWGNTSNAGWGIAAAILTPAAGTAEPLVMVV